MAILDADKEGFLRSERSLIQTIGRAARNLNGKAILYADRITNSMAKAMEETERRRIKQISFNEEHGIIPVGVKKEVKEMIDGVMTPVNEDDSSFNREDLKRFVKDEKALSRELKRLEKSMMDHAKNLEFEQAAAVRDQLQRLKHEVLLNS